MVDFGINFNNRIRSNASKANNHDPDIIENVAYRVVDEGRTGKPLNKSFQDTFKSLNNESYDWISFEPDLEANKTLRSETSETVLARAKVAQQMIKGNLRPPAFNKPDLGGKNSGIGSLQENDRLVPPPMQLGLA